MEMILNFDGQLLMVRSFIVFHEKPIFSRTVPSTFKHNLQREICFVINTHSALTTIVKSFIKIKIKIIKNKEYILKNPNNNKSIMKSTYDIKKL